MNQGSDRESSRLDEAVAAMRRMAVPQRPPDRTVLDALSASASGGFKRISLQFLQRIQRMHPLARYAVVASVLSALMLVGFGRRSELLLADVATAVSKHKTVRFESKVEKLRQPAGGNQRDLPDQTKQQLGVGGNWPMTRTNYATLDSMHSRSEDARGGLTIMDRAKGIFLRLNPQAQTAVVSKFPGVMKTIGILEILDELMKDKATIATNEELDGIAVVAYRLTKDEVSSTIWVDRATQLPVRVEMANTGKLSQKSTMAKFQWDPPISDPIAFFSVEPPAGYKVQTRNLFRDDAPGQK
jgi:hypothetical protein